MGSTLDQAAASRDYRAAREGLAHAVREAAVLDVEGADRESFLQGQLTQDVRSLAVGEVRFAAALTAKGKLLFIARVLGVSDRIRLLLPVSAREGAFGHLRKFAAFQKAGVSDRSGEFIRFPLYGPRGPRVEGLPAGTVRLPGFGEFSSELLVPLGARAEVERCLESEGSVPVSGETAEILRLEAGRPKFGRDIDGSNLPDEAGLSAAISTTKGCYVGQEIVARRRTYGRVNRRLVGWRFPDGLIAPGQRLARPEMPGPPARSAAGTVTSSAVSPRFGPIGLGFAFHDVSVGDRLVGEADPRLSAVLSPLPFA